MIRFPKCKVSLEYGYIKGLWRHDGVFEVLALLVYEPYRGKGYGKRLARHLPKRCQLQAIPLANAGDGLTEEQLIRFYEQLGFRENMDPFGRPNMIRGD